MGFGRFLLLWVFGATRRRLSLLRSGRRHVYVCQFCPSRQAVIRRSEWPCADRCRCSAHDWASHRGFALCVFRHEERIGRELCICCAACPGGNRVACRCEASETCMDAWWRVTKLKILLHLLDC